MTVKLIWSYNLAIKNKKESIIKSPGTKYKDGKKDHQIY